MLRSGDEPNKGAEQIEFPFFLPLVLSKLMLTEKFEAGVNQLHPKAGSGC
jgi:hypothetical protein